MPRVKRGVPAHQKHKKVLHLTEGQRASKHKLFRRANEAMLKSLSYAYAHRRERKSDFRKLWIARINAIVREEGLSYSRFIQGLKIAGITVDRKIMAELALNDRPAFAELVTSARIALAQAG
jgi:large subunit ribosomal protein L20